LLKEVKPADMVFSRPLGASGISTFIRSVDRSQFSHVSTYVGNGLTVDAGPAGVQKVLLAEYANTAHLAIYRFREPLTEQERSKVVETALGFVGGGYNWSGLLRVFLRKKLKLQLGRKIPSVSDLLFSEAFDLVAHV
jgi:uncharacterized protein YycO